jgi:hypothetical protein
LTTLVSYIKIPGAGIQTKCFGTIREIEALSNLPVFQNPLSDSRLCSNDSGTRNHGTAELNNGPCFEKSECLKGDPVKRNSGLKILNPILALLFLNQILTGLFHGFLPHDVFEIVHQGGGIILATATLLHVILNWNWVKANLIP